MFNNCAVVYYREKCDCVHVSLSHVLPKNLCCLYYNSACLIIADNLCHLGQTTWGISYTINCVLSLLTLLQTYPYKAGTITD